MKACIVICTYRRFDLLPKAIESALGQRYRAAGFETVVVDNSGQPQLSESIARRYEGVERLRYILEPLPGLSRARNIGWRSTDADIVAYFDDDAVAEPDWLEAMVNAFEETGDKAAVVGGMVKPIWSGNKPDWLHPSLESYLSIVSWGGARREIAKTEWLAGTNIGFKKSYLESTSGFEETLGRKESLLLSNEELALTSVIMGLGGKIIYEPAAVVHHLISPKRLSHDWFRQRVFWQAMSDLIASPGDMPATRQLWDGVENYFDRLPPRYRGPIGLFANSTSAELFRDELGAIYKLATMLGRGLPSPGFGVVVVATRGICNIRSAAGNRLADVVEYLSAIAKVHVCVVDPLTDVDLQKFDAMELPARKLFVGTAVSSAWETLVAVPSLRALLNEIPIFAVWLSRLDSEVASEVATFGGSVFVDTCLVKPAGSLDHTAIRPERWHVARYPGTVPVREAWQGVSAQNQFTMPYFRKIRTELDASWREPDAAKGMVVLCDETEANVLMHLSGEPHLRQSMEEATVILRDEARYPIHFARLLSLTRLSDDLTLIGPRPIACLDLCELNADYAFVREIMLRFDVPILPIATLREKRMPRLPKPGTSSASGDEYMAAIGSCLGPTSLRFQNDSGWRIMARLMKAAGKEDVLF